MKNILWLVILLPMLGCANMSEKEKTVAWVVGGIVITSIILSSSGDSNVPLEENCFFHMNSDGSTSTVCN